MRRLALALAIALAVPALPARAAAPKDQTTDTRKRAEEAFRDKRYADALALYLELAKTTNDPSILYNIARCHHELGDWAAAHGYYTRFAIEAPLDIRAKVPHLDEKIAFVAARTAVLDVRADVEGATITVDGRVVGAEPMRVNAGKLTIVGTKAGHRTDTRTIEIAPGARLSVRLQLPNIERGVLRLTSAVTATVAVDGTVVGTTPTELTVTPGLHRVEASAAGYETWRGTVTVAAGGTQTQTITLKESGGTPWWVWAGVSVVVVGGVVITYALVTERSADSGSYAPGQLPTGIHF